MKKMIFTVCTVLATGVYASYSSGYAMQEIEMMQVVSLENIEKNTLEGFSKGENPWLVLKCTQGVKLPFKVVIKGGYFELDDAERSDLFIRIAKTCYMRHSEGVFLFSDDLQNWKEFQQFFSGTVGISFDDANSQITLSVDLNGKQHQE